MEQARMSPGASLVKEILPEEGMPDFEAIAEANLRSTVLPGIAAQAGKEVKEEKVEASVALENQVVPAATQHDTPESLQPAAPPDQQDMKDGQADEAQKEASTPTQQDERPDVVATLEVDASSSALQSADQGDDLSKVDEPVGPGVQQGEAPPAAPEVSREEKEAVDAILGDAGDGNEDAEMPLQSASSPTPPATGSGSTGLEEGEKSNEDEVEGKGQKRKSHIQGEAPKTAAKSAASKKDKDKEKEAKEKKEKKSKDKKDKKEKKTGKADNQPEEEVTEAKKQRTISSFFWPVNKHWSFWHFSAWGESAIVSREKKKGSLLHHGCFFEVIFVK